MTLILDSGGVSALAGQRARLAELRRRGLWPAQVPAVVLTESLTGDHRPDFHENQLLRTCQIRDVTERLARDAALLRTRTGRASTISATDAIVAALAVTYPDPIVLTSDPDDLAALVAENPLPVTIARA
jgi:predicted nucleic acid-binding protein